MTESVWLSPGILKRTRPIIVFLSEDIRKIHTTQLVGGWTE
jgi:hypothetical protein